MNWHSNVIEYKLSLKKNKGKDIYIYMNDNLTGECQKSAMWNLLMWAGLCIIVLSSMEVWFVYFSLLMGKGGNLGTH